MDMIIFLSLTAIVALSAFFISSCLSQGKSVSDFLVSWFTVFFAQIVLVNLSLGIFGRLFLWNIASFHSVILLLSCFFFRKYNYLNGLPKADFSFILNNKLLSAALSVFLGFFIVKLFRNFLNPSVYADVMQYHLTFPAAWAKYGNLDNPIVIFDRNNPNILNALTYFPLNGEFFFFWLMLPLKNAFLANAGQAPFYIIGILAVYSILKKFDINRATALFIGALWALIPNILKQLQYGALVDVMCAVLFLIVLNHLINLKKELNLKNSILFAVSLGLLVGTKAINIFWSVTLVPLFIYYLSLHRQSVKSSRIVLILGAIALLALIFGGFSYIRNFVLTRNFFYPIEFRLFGRVIMPGVIDKITYSRFLVPWEEFKLSNMFFSEGLGAQLIVFIFPGTIIPLFLFPALRKKLNLNNDLFFLFLVPALMFLLYIFYIKAYWIRYFFPYLGAGFICSAIFLDKFKWGGRYISIFGGICILASAAEISRHKELVIAFILSALIFIILACLKKGVIFTPRKKSSRVLYLCLLSVLAASALISGNYGYNKAEFSRYPHIFSRRESAESETGFAWKWLNENTGSGKRIAYTGRGEFYPLFGSFLKNDVFYISLNDKPSIPHYYYDGDYRREKDMGQWLENLINSRIDFLFIYQMHDSPDFPIEDLWARENPKSFRLVFSNSKARIYSFQPE